MTKYHDQMVRLATEQYKDHQLEHNPTVVMRDVATLYYAPWYIVRPRGMGDRIPVEVAPASFDRVLVHGDCDPVLFGGGRALPLLQMIAERDWAHMDYVVRKVIPGFQPYYDEDKALADLSELFDDDDEVDDDGNSIHDDIELEARALLKAGALDRINDGDWPGLHAFLYEEGDFEAEYISDLGRVLAPPRFYYAVFAVKRLWELLEEAE